MFYKFTRKQLKNHKAINFKNGDEIEVNEKYLICIRYKNADKEYNTPALLSYVLDLNTYQSIDPFFWKQYISNFIS